MFDCYDCGEDTSVMDEYYMVWDALWLQAMPDAPDEMLCIGCLERRLFITLTPDDFTNAPINQGYFGMSDRLKERLGHDQ